MVNVQCIFFWNSTMNYDFINMIILNSHRDVGRSESHSGKRRQRRLFPREPRLAVESAFRDCWLFMADLKVSQSSYRVPLLKYQRALKNGRICFSHLLRRTQSYDYLHAVTLFNSFEEFIHFYKECVKECKCSDTVSQKDKCW